MIEADWKRFSSEDIEIHSLRIPTESFPWRVRTKSSEQNFIIRKRLYLQKNRFNYSMCDHVPRLITIALHLQSEVAVHYRRPISFHFA